MCSSSLRSNLVMQLIYVIADCQQYALRKNIFFSAIQISSEVHVFFHICEGSFRLNTTVHSQLSSVIAGHGPTPGVTVPSDSTYKLRFKDETLNNPKRVTVERVPSPILL